MAEFKYPLRVRKMAADKINEQCTLSPFRPDDMESSVALRALCAMVVDHCEEPEDPLLQEAREICAEAAEALGFLRDAEGFRCGSLYKSTSITATLAALKRYKPGAS